LEPSSVDSVNSLEFPSLTNPDMTSPTGEESGDWVGLSRSAQHNRTRPGVLALGSDALARDLRRALSGTRFGEGFQLRVLDDASRLVAHLRTEPTVVILADNPGHLGALLALKQEPGLSDVPTLFLIKHPDPHAYDLSSQGEAQLELARRALQSGCDDVIHYADESPQLVRYLDAIWRYHNAHGFAPPSGHSFQFSRRAQAKAKARLAAQAGPSLSGTQNFSLGREGSPHVLLVSDHPPLRLMGQQFLRHMGCHVSDVDSAFLAIHFLTRLAHHAEPETPMELQGKLDLVIVALKTPIANCAPLVRQIKTSPHFAQVPMLLLAGSEEGKGMLRPFRNKGIHVAIDPNPAAEDLAFRVHEILAARQDKPRESQRHLHAVPCTFRGVSEESAQEAWQTGLTFNMNRAGVYVRTLCPPTTQQIELRMRLQPMGILLEFRGEVVWTNPWRPASRRAYPPGIGVFLQEAAPSHAEALADFCDYLRESSFVGAEEDGGEGVEFDK
jgi:CheY-like chemotaxis protein